MSGRIAILIDGGYFLKQLPKLVTPNRCDTPQNIVACIRQLCRIHVKRLTGKDDARWQQHLYRSFFYDAMPYEGKAHHPIDNRPIDYAKTEVARQRLALFDCLRRERKLALRLGKVNKEHDWLIEPTLTKKLLRHRNVLQVLAQLPPISDLLQPVTASITLSAEEHKELTALRDFWQGLDDSSVRLGLRQKGVDMRIGIDISSLTLKKQVDTIILVAGDSDFVPAAKLARREGVEFILDPLWQKINADLFEHIDGLQSGLPRPGSASDEYDLPEIPTENPDNMARPRAPSASTSGPSSRMGN
ncbi:NYN domain-containing protein [Acidithiobacillus ferrooxidans]|uniref:NYN domain-containing protein n=1 Tax=Acidithiobacillus ferrooxidans TaxID=920 RepID=UPI001C07B083|nr:NYN domain-containing protein [Acidithiobacillus ferrooxidans]MBU2855423.1 NYN domain-containing protein [Acidithiobacillus ferrooxidans]MBU2861435.1 NYN domain-containing protein [Acidithiobacillus ferrooxidans]MCL5956621.1 NYN domain-containing protein [Gammaproteobacteria bacterium]